MIKTLANGLHALLARGPRCLARMYIELLSLFCRTVVSLRISTRIRNSIASNSRRWPQMRFSAREVIVGSATKINLVPHLGEFDEAGLFAKQLGYEDGCFKWLEINASENYDLVIEIGANVGVFTVFFDALARRGSRLRRVIAFEPSREAYGRLLSNLKANGATTVVPFNAAVGVSSGFQTFYEPEGHLTNGSFRREFSEIFSKTVHSTSVLAVGATELFFFIGSVRKALIKIDAEGFEVSIDRCNERVDREISARPIN